MNPSVSCRAIEPPSGGTSMTPDVIAHARFRRVRNQAIAIRAIRHVLLGVLFLALVSVAPHGLAQARSDSRTPDKMPTPDEIKSPPKTWIDPDTGHRVTRLTDEPGSASFYFNV